MKLIPPIGPLDASILLIGEFPSQTEEHLREPFSGSSGGLLKQIWAEVGLIKDNLRIDNFLQFRPHKNTISSVPEGVLESATYQLHQRIAALKDPLVIVPTGNYPLFALTGKGKVKAAYRKKFGSFLSSTTKAEKAASIHSLRGSVYFYEDLNGRRIKVIPTIHPKDVLKMYKYKKRTIRDWKLVESESRRRFYPTPIRRHYVNDSTEVVERFASKVRTYRGDLKLSIDIETWGGRLNCVGFAYRGEESLTIDLTSNRDLWFPYVRRLCEEKVDKIFQGGWYDYYWLLRKGIKMVQYKWDTLAMHHCLDPTESHDLAFLASYFTTTPYWKDEAKEAEEIRKNVSSQGELLKYNGLDVCVTWEVQRRLEGLLEEAGLLSTYHSLYPTLYPGMLSMMTHGVRVDRPRQKEWSVRLEEECAQIVAQLNTRAGMNLLGKKDFSGDKLKAFFYARLRCPKQYAQMGRKGGKERGITLDEKALKKLIMRYPQKAEPWASMVLRHRGMKKKTYVLRKGPDSDHRVRCTYRPTTEQGRLASSKNPYRTGYNLQNIEREKGGIRTTFHPDFDEWIFIRIDMSQIEDRECKMYTGIDRMRELANRHPTVYDAHTENAKLIFQKDDISKDERYFGKKVVHGAQRLMTGVRVSEELLKENIIKSPRYCQKLIDTYLEKNYEIKDNYFPFVEEQLYGPGVFYNSWGRRFDLRGCRKDSEALRKACSFYLQSECADLMNQWGVRASYDLIRENGLRACLNMQVHDEVIISSPPEEAHFIVSHLFASLEQPREIRGGTLVVPAELIISRSWDGGVEFPKLPSSDELNEGINHLFKGEGV